MKEIREEMKRLIKKYGRLKVLQAVSEIMLKWGFMGIQRIESPDAFEKLSDKCKKRKLKDAGQKR